MSQPGLWETPALPPGPLRGKLSARIDRARADGHEIPEDLELVALSLADRIDWANARGQTRGYVMLTQEYRAARDQLLGGLAAEDTDPLDGALAAFMDQEANAGK